MILIIDNQGSSTYNLYQTAGTFDPNVKVLSNKNANIKEIKRMGPSHIIISPGPGRPEDALKSKEVIREFAGKIPILGICLGHQAVCVEYGAKITYSKEAVHGKKSMVHIANGNPIFRNLPPLLEAGRYHSLSVDRSSLPDELLVIAETGDGEVMGIKHRDYDIFGLQFQPESILTKNGEKIIENFLRIGGGCR